MASTWVIGSDGGSVELGVAGPEPVALGVVALGAGLDWVVGVAADSTGVREGVPAAGGPEVVSGPVGSGADGLQPVTRSSIAVATRAILVALMVPTGTA
jgi:hypothetical protein